MPDVCFYEETEKPMLNLRTMKECKSRGEVAWVGLSRVSSDLLQCKHVSRIR